MPRMRTIVPRFDLPLPTGGVVCITGPSGSGKSSILTALHSALPEPMIFSDNRVSACASETAGCALIDSFDGELHDDLALLARVGLSEARVLIGPVHALSDGERARLQLARLMRAADQGAEPAIIMIDEFLALLDRDTAKTIAHLAGRWIRRTQHTLIVATAHDDIIVPLSPEVLVYKPLGDRAIVHAALPDPTNVKPTATASPRATPSRARKAVPPAAEPANRSARPASLLRFLTENHNRESAQSASESCTSGAFGHSSGSKDPCFRPGSSNTGSGTGDPRHRSSESDGRTSSRSSISVADGAHLLDDLYIETGSMKDYQALARFHYRGGMPRAVTSVGRIVIQRPAVSGRFYSSRSERETIGVIVRAMPRISCRLRDIAIGGRYEGFTLRERARLVNAEFRTIARVIVDPRFRGRGLAVALVSHVLAHNQTTYTEALAAMGALHPFFERAGMARYQRPPFAHEARLRAGLEELGVPLDALASSQMFHEAREAMSSARRTFLEREMIHYAGAEPRLSRDMPIGTIAPHAHQRLLFRPVYFITQHE